MTAAITVPELLTDPAGIPRARSMLARAEWAARQFARYDKPAVDAVVRAAAEAGAARAREYADWAVRETGFGVAEHKVLKNQACSLGVFERYRDEDFVSPQLDPAAKIISLSVPSLGWSGIAVAANPGVLRYNRTYEPL